jgi:peptide/nickel transport system permease protein
MTKYLLHRIISLLLSLLIGLTVIFILLRLLPGDPANALLSIDATPEQIAAAQAKVGSDMPIFKQAVVWFVNVLRGDFGTAFVSGMPVAPEVFKRLAVTVPLTLISFAISVVVACIIGFISAYKKTAWYAVFIALATQVGIAIPVFWVGIIFVWIFALRLGLLPSGGWPGDGWYNPVQAVRSIILPVCTIVFMMSATLTRYVRAGILNVLDSEYIRTSRSMGFSMMRSFILHGIRNASIPVISIFGTELSATLLGAVVVENIFSLPGLGSMLTKAVSRHDYPSLQGVLLATTFLVLVIGFFADVVQRILDPRLRLSREVRTVRKTAASDRAGS